MVLVTHDISVVAYLCDDVVVMYAGQVIESGPVREVLARPRHPYTMGLRNAFPDLMSDALELVPIGGSPPDLSDPPPGCRFAPRCPFALARLQRQARASIADGARTDPRLGLPARRRGRLPPQSRNGSRDMAALVELRDVVKHFPVARSLGEVVRGRASGGARARRRELRRGLGRCRGHRGRIGLRQDHPGAADAEARRADRGLDRLRRRRPGRPGRRGPARLPPPGPARLPEPVRCAQPALHHLPRRRRAAAQCRDRQGRAHGPRRVGLPARAPARPRPLSRQVSASAERRPAAERRAGACAGAGAALPGRRRAGVDARCQRARRHPRPDARGARRHGLERRLHLATISPWCVTSASARW